MVLVIEPGRDDDDDDDDDDDNDDNDDDLDCCFQYHCSIIVL